MVWRSDLGECINLQLQRSCLNRLSHGFKLEAAVLPRASIKAESKKTANVFNSETDAGAYSAAVCVNGWEFIVAKKLKCHN